MKNWHGIFELQAIKSDKKQNIWMYFHSKIQPMFNLDRFLKKLIEKVRRKNLSKSKMSTYAAK